MDDLNVKYYKERLEKEFWIDRFGKVYKFKGELKDHITSFHAEIAYDLFPGLRDSKTYLMDLGWVMVGSVVYNCPIIHKKPTQSQINTLFDLGLYSRLCLLNNGFYENYEKKHATC
jgi:hypothetical protein